MATPDDALPDELHAWAREDAALTNDEATALRDALWTRLAPAVAAGAAAAAGAVVVASAATSAASSGAAPSLVAKLARLTQLKLLGAGVAVGAVVGGAAVELSHNDPPPPSIQVAAAIEPAPTVASSPAPEPSPQPAEQPPPSGKPPLPKPKTVAPTSSPAAEVVDDTWDAERALVDAARTALLRNDLSSVRALTAEHAARFPDGALVEEREGMNVLARLRDPTDETAPEAARAFRARFPHSVLGRAIAAAVSAGTQENDSPRQGSATLTP